MQVFIFHRFTQSPWFCWTTEPFFIEFSDFSDSVFIPKPFSDSVLILTPFFKFKLSDTVRFLDGCSLKAKFLKALSFPSLLSTNESDSLSSVNFGKFFIFSVSVSSISAGNETEREPLSGRSSIWTWGSEFLLVF